jgi:hypothetical protein
MARNLNDRSRLTAVVRRQWVTGRSRAQVVRCRPEFDGEKPAFAG